jgi:hypothetical protein
MSWAVDFDVVVGENQILINCGETTVTMLREGVAELARYLDEAPPQGGFRARWRFERDRIALLRRLFPPAYVYGPAADEFRGRFAEGMRADLLGAARRVLASIGDKGSVLYPLAAIDDWIRVLGLTRLLWVRWNETGDPLSTEARIRNAGLFTLLQERLVLALRPDLTALLNGRTNG